MFAWVGGPIVAGQPDVRAGEARWLLPIGSQITRGVVGAARRPHEAPYVGEYAPRGVSPQGGG